MRQETGFLTLTAVVIIVVFGLFSAVLVAMVLRTGLFNLYFDAASKAGFLADSGLEEGRRQLTNTILSARQTCMGLSGSLTLDTGSFSVGRARDAANQINPRYAYTTLITPISANTTPMTISVSDSLALAPFGRVMIGREVFEYQGIADSTTLTGVTRTQEGTQASAHVSGELVSQYQCTMASIGQSSASVAYGIREYQQAVQPPVVFAVGENGAILEWNKEQQELSWQLQSVGGFDFNAISAINYHEAWAVADRRQGHSYRIARRLGNQWNAIELRLSQSRDLYGVHATSSLEAWAVGERGAKNVFTILQWTRDGGNNSDNWCELPCRGKSINSSGTSNQERELYAIQTVDVDGDGDADFGLTVGGRNGQGSGNRGVIMVYNGLEWSNLELPSANHRIGQLYGLDIVTLNNQMPREAYFVGRSSENNNQGKLLRWRDGQWSGVATTATVMRSISALDTNGDGYAEFVIAVGDGGSAYVINEHFSLSGPFTLSAQDLKEVKVLSSTDVWIVGNGGARLHYNGNTVESITTGAQTLANLNGLGVIFPKHSSISAWFDVIH